MAAYRWVYGYHLQLPRERDQLRTQRLYRVPFRACCIILIFVCTRIYVIETSNYNNTLTIIAITFCVVLVTITIKITSAQCN